MDNKTLQSLIYDQLYAASMYNYMTTLTNDEQMKSQFQTFEADSKNNARILEVYYEELNTSSYNPIIKAPVKHDDLYESILWMINYNGHSSALYIAETRRPTNDQTIRNITSYINNTINQHNTMLTAFYLDYLNTKKTSLP